MKQEELPIHSRKVLDATLMGLDGIPSIRGAKALPTEKALRLAYWEVHCMENERYWRKGIRWGSETRIRKFSAMI